MPLKWGDVTRLPVQRLPLMSICRPKVNFRSRASRWRDGEKFPARLLTPIVVNTDNIKDTVVKDGLYTIKDIRTPRYAAACAKADLQ